METIRQIQKFPPVCWAVIILNFCVAYFEGMIDFDKSVTFSTILLILLGFIYELGAGAILVLSTWNQLKTGTLKAVSQERRLVLTAIKRIPPLLVFMLIFGGWIGLYILGSALVSGVPIYFFSKAIGSLVLALCIFIPPLLLFGVFLLSRIWLAWPIVAIHGWETSNPFKKSKQLTKPHGKMLFALSLAYVFVYGVPAILDSYLAQMGAKSSALRVGAIVVQMIAWIFFSVFSTILYARLVGSAETQQASG